MTLFGFFWVFLTMGDPPNHFFKIIFSNEPTIFAGFPVLRNHLVLPIISARLVRASDDLVKGHLEHQRSQDSADQVIKMPSVKMITTPTALVFNPGFQVVQLSHPKSMPLYQQHQQPLAAIINPYQSTMIIHTQFCANSPK